MQTEKVRVSLEEEEQSVVGHALPAPCQACQQRHARYKTLFFVTLTLLLLSCGYIITNASANNAPLILSNSQITNQPKEASVAARIADEVPGQQRLSLKAVGQTTVDTKTENAEAPVAPAPAAVVPPVTYSVSPSTVVSPPAPTVLVTLTTPANQNASLAQVAKDDKKSKLYNFPLSEKSNLTVVFLTCCGRHYMLEEVILAFLELNEYPFKKLIVVNDGPSNREANAISEKFPNLTMISTGDKGGQLRAIDEALKLVDTPYVYYNEDDFKLVHSGLITLNIQELEKDPKILQMWNGWHFRNFLTGTRIPESSYLWGGFSLQPSVWRTSDYRSIQGGFANLTKDASRGTGAGEEEVTIIREFKSRGYYVKQTEIQYVQHLGKDRRLPRK